MTLTDKIRSLDFISDAEELNALFQDAQADYLFWEGRVITHPDYEGHFRLNAFQRIVDDAIPFGIIGPHGLSLAESIPLHQDTERKIDALTLKGRVSGIENLQRLHEFFDEANNAFLDKNIFLKIAIGITRLVYDIFYDHDYAWTLKEDLASMAGSWNFTRAAFYSFSEEKLKETFPNHENLETAECTSYHIKHEDGEFTDVIRYHVEIETLKARAAEIGYTQTTSKFVI